MSNLDFDFKWLIGGPGRDRTDDLFHAMEARSQLRHRPTSAGYNSFILAAGRRFVKHRVEARPGGTSFSRCEQRALFPSRRQKRKGGRRDPLAAGPVPGFSGKWCNAAWTAESLLQELGHFLLHAVGLRQGRDARLAQDLVLRHVRSRSGVVGGLHCVLR